MLGLVFHAVCCNSEFADAAPKTVCDASMVGALGFLGLAAALSQVEVGDSMQDVAGVAHDDGAALAVHLEHGLASAVDEVPALVADVVGEIEWVCFGWPACQLEHLLDLAPQGGHGGAHGFACLVAVAALEPVVAGGAHEVVRDDGLTGQEAAHDTLVEWLRRLW